MGKIIYWIKDFVKGTDKILLGLCMILSAIGTVMVYSATRVNLTENQVISRDAKTMFLAVVMGICVSLVISYFDYEAVARLWPIIAIICLGLMLSLFVIGSSPEGRDDAISWIKLGSFYFQPSELLKIGFIITFSVHLENVGSEINKLKNVILLAIHAMIAVGLVVLTGDMGSALVFMFITIGMLFMAGLQFRYFLFGIGAVALLAPIAWFEVLSDFQKQRFMAIYAPKSLTEATYNEVIFQQERGMNAVSSGGIFGTGLFNGTYTQNGLVPESENDMIFTVVGEELGFIGCIVVLGLLLAIAIKILVVGKKAISVTGKLICCAVAVMIITQVVVNVGMVLKLLPVVGITLPFMSAGGSSNLCIYIAIGMVLSVYRSSQFREPVEFKYGKLFTPFSDTY
ncbi:MAG TPA: FtsW/RodA/SpoVE family cell cycle protein [Oscillospiraceae bacterium]|nr:FtsW/RodA/SpoVE family cell cycle protein [Oscillospiraceae bacterium]